MPRCDPDLLPDDAEELRAEDRAARKRLSRIGRGEPPEPEEDDDETDE